MSNTSLYSIESIALILPSLESGGTERQAYNLAKELSHQFDVHFITIYSRGKYKDRLQQNPDIHLHNLERTGRWDFMVAFQLADLLQELQPEVLQSFLPLANTLGLISGTLARIPCLCTGLRASDMNYTRVGPRVYFWLDRALSNLLADRCICNSRAGMQVHEERGWNDNITSFIPNGIKIKTIQKKSQEETNIIRSDDSFSIGMFSRLSDAKDHETLLTAVNTLRKEDRKIHLHLAGRGSKFFISRLKRLIKTYDLKSSVSYYGELDNPFPVMKQMDLICLSSLTEGMNNSIMEAMALGKPVVATDAGDNSTLIENNRTGKIVPVGKPDRFAEAIRFYMDHPTEKKKHGDFGRDRIQLFDLSRMVTSYVDLYQEILDET